MAGGSGKVFTLRFLDTPVNFFFNKFFAPSTSSMGKVDDGEKTGKKGGGKKIMLDIVATNVIAS